MRPARKLTAFLTLALLAGGGTWLWAAGEEDASPPASAANLAAEVAQLKERVAQLEARLAALEGQPPIFTSPVPTQPQAVLPYRHDAPQRPPRTWGEGEINGTPYYFAAIAAPAD